MQTDFNLLTHSSIYTHFKALKKKDLGKHLEKVKLLKLCNFTCFHNVFYAICILKSFKSHISVFVCSCFEFGTVSKWCIREWINCIGVPDHAIPCFKSPEKGKKLSVEKRKVFPNMYFYAIITISVILATI